MSRKRLNSLVFRMPVTGRKMKLIDVIFNLTPVRHLALINDLIWARRPVSVWLLAALSSRLHIFRNWLRELRYAVIVQFLSNFKWPCLPSSNSLSTLPLSLSFPFFLPSLPSSPLSDSQIFSELDKRVSHFSFFDRPAGYQQQRARQMKQSRCSQSARKLTGTGGENRTW